MVESCSHHILALRLVDLDTQAAGNARILGEGSYDESS